MRSGETPKKRTVLSLEQATALPHATLRFAQLGWRVIRIEPVSEGKFPGDPNRYVGHQVDGEGMHAAFIAPNVGKEAIALDLKSAAGQEILKTIIRELDVDVFCCNVLPKSYVPLGIDYETLSSVKPDLIWAGISALGPEHPEVPGYDPVIQAMSGLMDINGSADGPPTLMGLPVSDLKAGDEVYSAVLLGLLEREATGLGRRIDVSMLQAAMSWLIAVLPLVDLKAPPEMTTRNGNAHRQFVPTSVYAVSDGHVYLALGNEKQWSRFTGIPGLESLDREEYATLALRTQNKERLYADIGTLIGTYTLAEITGHLAAVGLPHSTINTVRSAMELPAAAPRLLTTEVAGAAVRLPPPASGALPDTVELSDAPRYGQDTMAILREIGLSQDRIDRHLADRVASAASPATATRQVEQA